MDESTSHRARIPYLDWVRVIACVMVLLIHAIMWVTSYTTPSTTLAVYLTAFTVSSKLFFLITGALLIPTTTALRKFLPHRLRVVAIPLIIWSGIYLVEHIVAGTFCWRDVYCIAFHPIEESLWFVYCTLVIYCFIPIISRCMLAIGKRGIELCLLAWLLATLIPYQHGLFASSSPATHNMLSGFASYLGYVVLGYYLHTWPLPVFTRRHGWKFALLFAAGIVGMPLLEFLVQGHYGVTWIEHIQTVTDDLSINSALMAVLVFSACQHFAPASYTDGRRHCISRAVTTLSKCSYGIFLSHILVMRCIVWPYLGPTLVVHGANLPLFGLIVTAVTLTICLTFFLLIGRTPLALPLMGRKL